MKNIGDQFMDIITPRLGEIEERVAKPMVEKITEQMKENTRQGQGFGNDPYQSQYKSASHVKVRKKKGFQTSHVDLRMQKKRIENTYPPKKAEIVGKGEAAVQVGFNEGGQIMLYHHTGRAKGSQVRSIFPKTPESVPQTTINEAQETLHKVLSGA